MSCINTHSGISLLNIFKVNVEHPVHQVKNDLKLTDASEMTSLIYTALSTQII